MVDVTKLCGNCKKEFPARSAVVANGTNYCSQHCRNEWLGWLETVGGHKRPGYSEITMRPIEQSLPPATSCPQCGVTNYDALCGNLHCEFCGYDGTGNGIEPRRAEEVTHKGAMPPAIIALIALAGHVVAVMLLAMATDMRTAIATVAACAAVEILVWRRREMLELAASAVSCMPRRRQAMNAILPLGTVIAAGGFIAVMLILTWAPRDDEAPQERRERELQEYVKTQDGRDVVEASPNGGFDEISPEEATDEVMKRILSTPKERSEVQRLGSIDEQLTAFQNQRGISDRIVEAAIKEWVTTHNGNFDYDLDEVKATCLRNKRNGIPYQYLPESEKK